MHISFAIQNKLCRFSYLFRLWFYFIQIILYHLHKPSRFIFIVETGDITFFFGLVIQFLWKIKFTHQQSTKTAYKKAKYPSAMMSVRYQNFLQGNNMITILI